MDGSFIVNAGPDAVLDISSIGYIGRSILVGGRSEINIVLEEDAMVLQDVVVVATACRRRASSPPLSPASPPKTLSSSPDRIDAVLQGMTSGVYVTQASGAPDASSQVRIRGVGTINSSNPLYIVDGLAISGGIDYLNPNDIERIEVLKDAASSAVYGARAASGVILVTTKKGVAGKTRVAYDASYGWQNPWRKPRVLNGTEYAIMMNEGYVNAGSAPRYDDPIPMAKEPTG